MKYIILSLNAGGGHNAAANAIRDALLLKGAEATVSDCLEIVSPLWSRLVCGSYLEMVKHFPSLFGAVYRLSFHLCGKRRKSIVYAANARSAGRISKLIQREKPDGVIVTHIFAAQQLTYLRRHGEADLWTGGVITDYDVQPFWNETELDRIFSPSAELSDGYAEKGTRRELLVETGIPVDPTLREADDLRRAKRENGLDPDRPCVLVAGGSMGAGKMPRTVEALLDGLPEEVQFVVVCGNNRRLKKHFARMKVPESRMKVLGFVRPLHRLMRAADVVISKPGGLSSTEVFEQRIPLVAVHPILGVESNNAAYLKKQGVALCPETDAETVLDVRRLLTEPALVEHMKRAQRKLVPGGASQEIAQLVIRETEARAASREP